MKKSKSVLSLIICIAMLMCSLVVPSESAWGQEIQEHESETETGIVSAESVSESEASEEETQAETQPIETKAETEIAKKGYDKTTRAGGNDRSSDFGLDKLVIKVNGVEAYRYDGTTGTVTKQEIISYGSQSINFEIKWSADDDNMDTFLNNDFLVFEICKVAGDNTTVLSDLSSAKPLYDDNGVQLGTGHFLAEKQSDGTIKLLYKVIFNSAIENKSQVHGSMDGGATIKGTGDNNKVIVSREGETIAEIEKKKNPSGEKPPGPSYETQIPSTSKVVSGVNESNGIVNWRIEISEYVERQFADYESGTPPTYEDFIVEEMLDCYQTFNTTSYYHAGASVTVNVPTYIYDKNGLNDGNMIIFAPCYFNLGAKSGVPMTYIDPAVDLNAETTVKNTAKTWTIVKEADPENAGKQRERMIINFGSPGSDGLKYSEISNFATTLSKLKDSRDNAKAVLDSNPTAGSSIILTDDYGTVASKEKWQSWYEMARDSYDYYLTDPYVYAGSLNVSTKVDTEAAATAGSVKNGFRLSGGYTEFSDEASQSNFWSGNIGADIKKGDIVLYKADSLYANDQSALENDTVLGGQKDIEFQVFKKGSTTPLTFDLDDGKYTFAASGSHTNVKTDAAGRIVISGLVKGDYYIKEVSNPAGYYTDQNQKIEFNLSTDAVNYILAENVRRGVRFVKVDSVNTSTTLAGAEFELYSYTQSDYSDAVKVTGFSKETIGGTDYLVYDTAGTEKIETGTDGKICITNLPAGKYYIVETVAPSGYDVDNTKHTFELESGLPTGDKIVNLGNIENTETVIPTGGVKLFKADSLYDNSGNLSGSTVIQGPMAGIEFEVYEKATNTKLSFTQSGTIYSYNQTGTISKVTTDTAGTLTIDGLVDGDYYFKEISNPAGYYADQNQKIEFTINTGGTSGSMTYVLAENIRRGVRFVKVDSVNTSTTLAGAEFELYSYTQSDYSDAVKVTGFSKETISGTDYLVYDTAGTEKIETGTDGKICITNLPAGKYYIVETVAPSGYDVDHTKHTFELESGLPTGDKIVNLGNIENTETVIPTGGVKLFKADSLYDNSGNLSGSTVIQGPMAGIEFEVYEKATNTKLSFTQSGTIYSYNQTGTISKVTTDTAGTLTIDGLVDGDYYFKEISNPAGYYADQNQKIEFTINTGGTSGSMTYVLAENIRRGVRFVKVDSVNTSTTLAGAEFELYSYTQSDYSDAVKVTGFSKETIGGTDYLVYDTVGTEKIETGTDGKICITNLPAGKYYIVETVAPSGYDVDHTKHTFELESGLPTGDKIVNLGNIENTETVIPTGGVKLFKADSLYDNSGNLDASTVIQGAMRGIEFEVYEKATNTKLSFDQIGTIYSYNPMGTLDKVITDTAGAITIDGLVDGDYYFKEISNPAGYYADQNQKIEFTINTGGTSGSMTYVLAKNIRRGVSFVKVDDANISTTLTGAEFELYSYTQSDYSDAVKITGFSEETVGAATHLVYDTIGSDKIETGADGKTCITNLPAGKYYIVETKAPEGYDLSTEKYPFELGAELDLSQVNLKDGILDAGVIKNKKTEPDTEEPTETETDTETETETETATKKVKETVKKPSTTKTTTTTTKSSPKTGDSSQALLYGMILLGSLFIIGSIVIHKRRKGNAEK